MSTFNLKYSRYGSCSILIEWPSVIDNIILQDIINFKKKLQNNLTKEKVEIINAYNSLLISYDFTIDNINDRIFDLKQVYASNLEVKKDKSILWKIPVCYDSQFGIDLNDFSIEKQLTNNKIIQLHCAVVYTVFFAGFLPGFLYLGGLDNQLHLERKSTPNLNIEKGSVAIGGQQTGIYPQNSPGGWHIIGNSPVNFFNHISESPCFAKAGDKLQFIPISKKEHHDILVLVKAGVYQIESEVVDG